MLDSDSMLGIDKAEYALLNAVSLDEWLVYLLAGEVGMEGIMNQPAHGLGESELIERFFRLWDRGLIECTLDEYGPPVAPDFELAREQFEHTRDWRPTNRALVYRLSSSGGALWEAFAVPQWTKFIRRGTGTPPDKVWVLSGGDRSLVERALRCEELNRRGPQPVPGTERWEVMQPWKPTYWKTLPIGYHFTFQYAGYAGSSLEPDAYAVYRREYDELASIERTWCKSFEEVCREYFEGQ